MKNGYLIEFSITNKCNLKCSYCYAGVGSIPKIEMNKNTYMEVLDNLSADIGDSVSIFALSGGEPTIHPDLLFFYQYAKQKFPSAPLYLQSNGIMLGKDTCLIKNLVLTGLSSICISFQSLIQKEMETINGIKGSYPLVVQGIKNCVAAYRKYGFPHISTNTVLTNKNKDSFLDTIEFLIDLGVPYLASNSVCPVGNGEDGKDNIDIRTASVLHKKAYALAKTKGAEFVNRCSYNFCEYDPRPENLKHYSCIVGKYFIVIDTDGNLKICPHSKNIVGSLLEPGSFKRMWESEFFENYRLQKNVPDECKKCSKLKECGGPCPSEKVPLNLKAM